MHKKNKRFNSYLNVHAKQYKILSKLIHDKIISFTIKILKMYSYVFYKKLYNTIDWHKY